MLPSIKGCLRMAPQNGHPDDLVSIGNFNDLATASVARSALEAAGIRAYLTNENTVGVQWLYTTALGGMDLMVARRDAESARQLLDSPALADEELAEIAMAASTSAEAVEENVAKYDTVRHCPRCKSTDWELEERKRPWPALLAQLILMAAFLMPIPYKNEIYRCSACGKKWK